MSNNEDHLQRRRPCKFYFSRSLCLKGTSCTFSHSLSEIGFPPNAVAFLEEEYKADSLIFERMARNHPVEKWFTQPCSFYVRGFCDRGDLCTFQHDPMNYESYVEPINHRSSFPNHNYNHNYNQKSSNSLSICIYWQKGCCNRGEECPFWHPERSNSTSSGSITPFKSLRVSVQRTRPSIVWNMVQLLDVHSHPLKAIQFESNRERSQSFTSDQPRRKYSLEPIQGLGIDIHQIGATIDQGLRPIRTDVQVYDHNRLRMKTPNRTSMGLKICRCGHCIHHRAAFWNDLRGHGNEQVMDQSSCSATV